MSDYAGTDVSKFKRQFRESSGWPNVQEEIDNRRAIAKANAKEAAMKAAGAKLAEEVKRGPGRPPKSSNEETT